MADDMISLAVLGSTRGTHLSTLVSAIQENRLHAKITIVISNKQDALILERAKSYGLVTQFIDASGLSREVYDEQVAQVLKAHDVSLIVLIGYMRILSQAFTEIFQHKIINVHPSLLPAHAGKMDLAVHEAVLAAGEKETGCTVHYVTKEVDAGPIILQKKCAVLTSDTPLTLKARVQQLEGDALVEAINHVQSKAFSFCK